MPSQSTTHPHRPRDLSLLAHAIVDEATAECEPVATPAPEPVTAAPEPEPVEDKRNPAAVALGRLGGLKGGKALAAASSEALARIAEITKALFPAGVQSELTEYGPLDHASAEDLISLAEVNQIISTLERKHDMDSVQMMTRYRSGDLSDNEDYSEWSLLLRARDQHYEQS